MNIQYLVSRLWRTKGAQQWINNHYKDHENPLIHKEFFPYVITTNGDIYRYSSQIYTVQHVLSDYSFSDIQKDDIVIDVGANIGGFSIPAARLSQHVYAVEPLTTDELRENINRNHVDVKVIEGGLGDGTQIEMHWEVQKRLKDTYSFHQLKELCGGCTFLKCDCEGFEWYIRPEDLDGIQRIEMEIHNFNPTPNDPKRLLDAILEEFDTGIIPRDYLEKIEEHLRNKLKDKRNNRFNSNEIAILHATRK